MLVQIIVAILFILIALLFSLLCLVLYKVANSKPRRYKVVNSRPRRFTKVQRQYPQHVTAEVKYCKTHSFEGLISCGPTKDNLYEWEASFTGPQYTPYQDGIYHVKISLPDSYPYDAPEVYYDVTKCKCYHSDVDPHNGSISSINILKQAPGWTPGWTPACSIIGLLEIIRSDLCDDIAVQNQDEEIFDHIKMICKYNYKYCNGPSIPICLENMQLYKDNVSIDTEFVNKYLAQYLYRTICLQGNNTNDVDSGETDGNELNDNSTFCEDGEGEDSDFMIGENDGNKVMGDNVNIDYDDRKIAEEYENIEIVEAMLSGNVNEDEGEDNYIVNAVMSLYLNNIKTLCDVYKNYKPLVRYIENECNSELM